MLEKPHLRDGARKRTAEKLFRRGGLTWGANGGLLGLARDAGKTGTDHFPPVSELECTSLSLVSSLGATPYDSATHLFETISFPIGCQHISHAGALYCRTTTASNACSAAMQLRINQIPVPNHTSLDRIITPASQEPRWNSYY